jgi:CheY-like chemotaxis protein
MAGPASWNGGGAGRTAVHRRKTAATPSAQRIPVRDAVPMPLRCLIVDDSQTFLASARRLLESQGLVVVGLATSGAEAIQLARELRPDVALIDIELAGESGGDVARDLDEATEGQTPVILISAHAGEDVTDLATKTTVAGFLPKAQLSKAAVIGLIGDP